MPSPATCSGNIRRQLPKPKTGFLNLVKRDIAIYGNRIFMDTSDLHVVALDMKTGEVAWDHEILDRDKNPRVMMTGGPLAAKGKIIVGTVGQTPGRQHDRCAGCRHRPGSLAL